jgi:hypothetical protein
MTRETLHVVVESHWHDERWEGEIPAPPQGSTTLATLEYLFRYFNRVDEEDGPRLSAIGYTLPSLSVDVFDKRWRCANTGWELI